MAHDDRTHVTGPTADEAIRPLVHSHDLDHFKIPDGDPDPRGWDVKTADGRDLGKVSDLLVDTETGRVRYLELAVDKDVVKAGAREYYLIPIGEARLDDARDDVVVNLSAADLANVPVYERGRVSRTYEQSLRTYVRDRPGRQRAAGAATTAAAMGAGTADRDVDFYGGAEYDDRSFFGSRRAAGRTVGDRLATAADDLKDRVDGNPASRPGPDATDRPGYGTADASGVTRGVTGAAARGADRVADAADDLKDRVDGNPASRPGRDATDRPAR